MASRLACSCGPRSVVAPRVYLFFAHDGFASSASRCARFPRPCVRLLYRVFHKGALLRTSICTDLLFPPVPEYSGAARLTLQRQFIDRKLLAVRGAPVKSVFLCGHRVVSGYQNTNCCTKVIHGNSVSCGQRFRLHLSCHPSYSLLRFVAEPANITGSHIISSPAFSSVNPFDISQIITVGETFPAYKHHEPPV